MSGCRPPIRALNECGCLIECPTRCKPRNNLAQLTSAFGFSTRRSSHGENVELAKDQAVRYRRPFVSRDVTPPPGQT